jgi:hypothetical protein
VLIYDPSQDVYHAAIRILTVLTEGQANLALDTVRIADYYLVFPAALDHFRFLPKHRGIRALARAQYSPYRRPAGAWVTFERMRPIFMAAVSCLAAAGYVDPDQAKVGRLALTSRPLVEPIQEAVATYLTRQARLRAFIAKELTALPLLGKDGLKDRSGLLEYRYDVV